MICVTLAHNCSKQNKIMHKMESTTVAASPEQLTPDAEQQYIPTNTDMSSSVKNPASIHADLFKEYPELSVKKISRTEREQKELPNRSLVYGEIPFNTVQEIFAVLRSKFGILVDRGGNFYDIGSGCGKVIMAAVLLHNFQKACGIEILDSLHAVALKVLDKWRYQIVETLPAQKSDIDIGFAKGDVTKLDLWKDATLIFCNSTCFSDSLIQAISTVADTLNDGTYFVTVTKPIVSNRWTTMFEQKFDMSWGKATVIIQKKVF